jgi:hypothetical protein
VKGDACAECGRTLDLEATVYRARGGGFRCGGCEVRGERVYFSRFPDAQPPAELVTIHEHLLERGRCLVVEWFWDSLESTYFQRSVVNVPSLQNAKEYAPPRSVPVPVPAEFGLLAYEVRS